MCGIDRKRGEYQYKYLREDRIRGSVLFKAIKPFLRANDIFFDINCGFSPMADQILEHGYKITGFDIHPEPIEYLKSEFPHGDWKQISYESILSHENILYSTFTIMLLLGFSITSHGEKFLYFVERNIIENRPRLIITEVSKKKEDFSTSYQKAYLNAVGLIKKHKYDVCAFGEYDAKIQVASKRIYEIWEKDNMDDSNTQFSP